MKSSQALAAQAIRRHIKGLGLKCKVTSRGYTGGSSVNVTIFDQTPEMFKKIADEVDRYQYGDFDAMTDGYNYREDNEDLPRARFTMVDNDFSDEFKQKAWTHLKENYNSDGVFPESFKDLTYNNLFCGELATVMIRRLLCGSPSLGNDFWPGVK